MRVLPIVCACMLPMQGIAEEKAAEHEEKEVPFLKIGPADYRNFLKSWDEKKSPVFCALIRTPAQYGGVFHIVPLRNDKRPAAPPDEIYEKEQLLVVARVVPYTPDSAKAKIFDSIWLSEKGGDLELHYRHKPPKDATSHKTKTQLIIRIPKRDYRKITVFENEKVVGELKPADGVWAAPAVRPFKD